MCFACSSRCDSARKCVFWVKAWQFGDSVLCHGVILGFVLSDSRFCVCSLGVRGALREVRVDDARGGKCEFSGGMCYRCMIGNL